MPEPSNESQSCDLRVDLKNPGVAAFWAWFWPGAGHLYQGRTAKGLVFMVAILTTYFFGLAIGKGNVVYASFRADDWRLQYVCQVGVGLPAIPALVQSFRVAQRQQPIAIFGNKRFMAPPAQVRGGGGDELSEWHKRPAMSFEMGTVYTMIAGLLNILAICDAYAGPLLMSSDEKKRRAREKSKQENKSSPVKESSETKSVASAARSKP
jgi:hypothetical protein